MKLQTLKKTTGASGGRGKDPLDAVRSLSNRSCVTEVISRIIESGVPNFWCRWKMKMLLLPVLLLLLSVPDVVLAVHIVAYSRPLVHLVALEAPHQYLADLKAPERRLALIQIAVTTRLLAQEGVRRA